MERSNSMDAFSVFMELDTIDTDFEIWQNRG